MRLRQIALVAGGLEAEAAKFAAVLGLGAPYADPGVAKYGLRNAVFAVGDTFLEIVSPDQPGTTAGRLLEKRGGNGGYMVILQVDDLAAARARVVAAHARIVDQADLDHASFTHVHPKDTGGAMLSLDAMSPPQHWEWGGPAWRAQVRTERSIRITGAELRGGDPAAMAARWAEILGRPLEARGDRWAIALDQGELRFAQTAHGDCEGLSVVDVAVPDAGAVREAAEACNLAVSGDGVEICGVCLRLVAAGDLMASGDV